MQVSVKTPLQLWREEITPSPLLLFQLDALNAIVHRVDGGWDRKHIRIEVCELCEYWPLNGDQALTFCKQCGQQVDYRPDSGVEPTSLLGIYLRASHAALWGPPTVQRLLPVKV